MRTGDKTVLVFGATGQQGGSVASALLLAGWTVRAFVRDPNSPKARALLTGGAELAEGDLADADSMRRAMDGAYGVFSVQPSSGQGAMYNVSDEQEVAYGTTIANLAVAAGVEHLVYSSANAVREQPSGMGHFDSKARIERHLRSLPIPFTIIRPAAFMDLLMMPGFGLPEGTFDFFMRPDGHMQFVAVEDIGRIVAAIFAAPERFAGIILEIAGDDISGLELAEALSEAAGRPIGYRRFGDDVLAKNPFLAGLTKLVDDGRLAGQADIEALRSLHPDLLTFRRWLAGPGRPALEQALSAEGAWDYGNVDENGS